MKKILDVKKLNVTYFNKKKEVYAVKDISFEIFKGDSLGIVGESGSGKSTLAMAILRLLNEKSSRITGQVYFGEDDILTYSKNQMREIRWNDIAVVFQKSMNSLSPVHKISTQIEDIYKAHKPEASKEEIREKMVSLLKMVNLPDRVYEAYPHELSGGMLQRISIAVSLLHNPRLLVLDEATTALDVVTQGQILKEIEVMETELDMTRIMITHDISVVSASCNKVAVMYAGELMEHGDTLAVLTNPKHPYTKGLLTSFPSLKGDKKELKAINGFLPDLSETYQGCIFAPRCQQVMDVCKRKKPSLEFVENENNVACFLYGGDVDE